MKGIGNLKEVCVFLSLCLTAEQKVMEDGSVTVGDVYFAMNPLLALPAALGDISEVPGEISDLDAAEAAELHLAIAEALDLKDDAVEAVAEQVVGAALQIAAAALALKQAKAA